MTREKKKVDTEIRMGKQNKAQFLLALQTAAPVELPYHTMHCTRKQN